MVESCQLPSIHLRCWCPYALHTIVDNKSRNVLYGFCSGSQMLEDHIPEQNIWAHNRKSEEFITFSFIGPSQCT
jgi:hypothetical protein